MNREISFPAGFVWEAVSLGRYGSCGIARHGLLLCWAMCEVFVEQYTRSYGGQARPEPVGDADIAKGRWWTAVSAGSWHNCAIDTAAGLWCWGSNSSEQTAMPVN